MTIRSDDLLILHILQFGRITVGYKGKRRIYFKKAPVYSSSVQLCGQPAAVTVPVEQSYDSLWTCVMLPLITPHAGGVHYNLPKRM